MNQLRKLAPILLLLILASCAPVQPGHDAVLVNAERTTSLAYTTFDTFLKLERDQEVYVKANLPQIHTFANSLRVNGPKYLTSARAATEAYRTNRDEANKATLTTAIAILQAAIAQVQKYTLEIPAQ